MPSISMVIPTYSVNDELVEVALNAVASYRDQVDELIICEDGGKYSDELRKSCDIYLYSGKNVGFTKNVNRGWKLATGDYVMIVNSDTTLLHHGDLKELCREGQVTNPRIAGLTMQDGFKGCFWCTPKEVTKKRGMLLEDLKTYYSDNEYYERIKDIFTKVAEVVIDHEDEKTTRTTGINNGVELRKDLAEYERLKKLGIAK